MIYIDVSGGNVYETYIETKKSEFEKFAPTLNVSMVVGTAEERKQVKWTLERIWLSYAGASFNKEELLELLS